MDTNHKFSISQFCEASGMKRDAFYKYHRRNQLSEDTAEQVISMVREHRKEQPRGGARKMHIDFKDDFLMKGIKVGRDKLFDILRDHDMLDKRKRSFVKTTNSYHKFHKYSNLIKDLEITRPNQAWASDISDSLKLAGCIRALKMALAHARPAPGLIHHSDRGLQY